MNFSHKLKWFPLSHIVYLNMLCYILQQIYKYDKMLKRRKIPSNCNYRLARIINREIISLAKASHFSYFLTSFMFLHTFQISKLLIYSCKFIHSKNCFMAVLRHIFKYSCKLKRRRQKCCRNMIIINYVARITSQQTAMWIPNT